MLLAVHHALSCSPNFATLPAVAILTHRHHPSQRLYCGELLFATLPTAAHHTRRHHPSQWLYCGELLFATLPAAAILATAITTTTAMSPLIRSSTADGWCAGTTCPTPKAAPAYMLHCSQVVPPWSVSHAARLRVHG